jgi:hypothetical protein
MRVPMQRRLFLFLTLCCLFAAKPRLRATDYCVDNTLGSDTNPGTCEPYRPWASINRVNQGPTGPGSKYLPGDAISFRGEQTFKGTLSFSPANSAGKNAQRAAMPMTISSCGDGRATISSADGDGLVLTNVSGFNIHHIDLVGTSLRDQMYTASGIRFLDNLNADMQLKNLIIDRVDVGGYGLDGVAFWVTTKSTLTHVNVTNVTAHDNGDGGVLMCGTTGAAGAISDVYVGHVVAFNNTGIPEPYADSACGSGLGLGIYFLGVTGGMVEYSTAHDNGSNSPADSPNCGPTSIMANVSDQIVFQHNEVYNSKAGGCGIDGNAFSMESGVTNSVMQYNYAHDNDGTGLMVFNSYNNVTIRYNITENNALVGPDTGELGIYGGSGPTQNVTAYNNTLFKGNSPSTTFGAVVLWSPQSRLEHIHLYNNIVYTDQSIPLVNNLTPPSVTDLRFQGNAYWPGSGTFQIQYGQHTYASLDAWRKATGQEKLNGSPVGFQTDPGLCDPGEGGTMFPKPLNHLAAYLLQPGSPMIDEGLDLPMLFGINVGQWDFYGNPIPTGSGYDVGANEFQPGQTCP